MKDKPLLDLQCSREAIEASTKALRGDVEEVVDWSQEPLREQSEAREDSVGDEKNDEVGEVV